MYCLGKRTLESEEGVKVKKSRNGSNEIVREKIMGELFKCFSEIALYRYDEDYTRANVSFMVDSFIGHYYSFDGHIDLRNDDVVCLRSILKLLTPANLFDVIYAEMLLCDLKNIYKNIIGETFQTKEDYENKVGDVQECVDCIFNDADCAILDDFIDSLLSDGTTFNMEQPVMDVDEVWDMEEDWYVNKTAFISNDATFDTGEIGCDMYDTCYIADFM